MVRLLLVTMLMATVAMAAEKLEYIPLTPRPHEFVPPETVGVGKDCPFPTVKEKLEFKCPKCKLRSWTHVLYPHLPHCPKCRCPMNEVIPLPPQKQPAPQSKQPDGAKMG